MEHTLQLIIDHSLRAWKSSDEVQMILDHDAALRAQLTEAQNEVADMKHRTTIALDSSARTLAHEKIGELEQQLAQAQNELCTAKDQIPPDMDGDSLSVALIKLKDERIKLAQARQAVWKEVITELSTRRDNCLLVKNQDMLDSERIKWHQNIHLLLLRYLIEWMEKQAAKERQEGL